jgi:hypothetical protein
MSYVYSYYGEEKGFGVDPETSVSGWWWSRERSLGIIYDNS